MAHRGRRRISNSSVPSPPQARLQYHLQLVQVFDQQRLRAGTLLVLGPERLQVRPHRGPGGCAQHVPHPRHRRLLAGVLLRLGHAARGGDVAHHALRHVVHQGQPHAAAAVQAGGGAGDEGEEGEAPGVVSHRLRAG